jgi:hypothetical protein
MSMKNSNDTIGNRTGNLPACSAVPRQTALPRAPITDVRNSNIKIVTTQNARTCTIYFFLLAVLPEAYRRLTVRRETLHRVLAEGRKSVIQERRMSQMRRESKMGLANNMRPVNVLARTDEE